MEIRKTELLGLEVLIPTTFTDERGYFMETFRKEWLTEINFIQSNESFSKKNVIRGLHYQKAPFAQSKLVRCIMGSIVDVAVDLRRNSPTLGHYFKIELSGENKKQLFIPRGFAHGFVTLSEWAVVGYKVDNYYNKESEVTICYDDKELGIDWGIDSKQAILSVKDKEGFAFAEANLFE